MANQTTLAQFKVALTDLNDAIGNSTIESVWVSPSGTSVINHQGTGTQYPYEDTSVDEIYGGI